LRKHILVCAVIALLSASTLGQSTLRFDAFGGYSYLHSDPGSGLRSADASGWATSLNWNWNRWLGLKSDFSGSYCCTGQRENNLLFGPQVTFRREHANFFVHGLGGVSHGNPGGVSDNVAAYAFGGGVDWRFTQSGFGLRLGQLDYLATRYGGITRNNVRYSTGFVFNFGGKNDNR